MKIVDIEIRELRNKDHKKAVKAAIKGMHFNWYMDNRLLLNLYGKYFWYLELLQSTQIIAAYVGDEFAGVLLAKAKSEKKQYYSFWKLLYVRVFDYFQKRFYKESVGIYDKTNEEMYLQYSKTHSPDGEIIFLAANPEIKVKGIGSKLLNELEQREKGKECYLYTDNACTYQFYEHRGFERVGEKEIVLEMPKGKVPLKCFIYSKKIPLHTV